MRLIKFMNVNSKKEFWLNPSLIISITLSPAGNTFIATSDPKGIYEVENPIDEVLKFFEESTSDTK